MTGRGDELYEGLLDLESSAPVGEPPLLHGRRRRLAWVVTGGLAAAGALAVGVYVGGGFMDRNGTGDLVSPTAAPTASHSARPTAPRPSPGPTSTPPASTPSATAPPIPSPTIRPRADWSVTSSDALAGVDRLDGIAEARGRLFALGSDAGVQPMIWFSDDGETWQPANVPDLPDNNLGGQVKALVETDDGLVAAAALGYVEGSGYFGAMIYRSGDGGVNWEPAESTPGLTAGAMFDLARAGSRIVAVGSAIWVSDDRGRTWSEAASREKLDGTASSIDGGMNLLLAAGRPGSDVVNPPALAWISRDNGETWERIELDEAGAATGALVTSSGEMLVSGYDAMSGERSILWSSEDGGSVWSERNLGDATCCSTGLVETPTGIVIGVDGQPSGGLASTDGQSWAFEPVGFRMRKVAWTPTFGLLAITGDSEIAFGPEPYP